MTLAMFADSGLPKSFWWDAYVTTWAIVRLMTTRMCRGCISPAEYVSGGQIVPIVYDGSVSHMC